MLWNQTAWDSAVLPKRHCSFSFLFLANRPPTSLISEAFPPIVLLHTSFFLFSHNSVQTLQTLGTESFRRSTVSEYYMQSIWRSYWCPLILALNVHMTVNIYIYSRTIGWSDKLHEWAGIEVFLIKWKVTLYGWTNAFNTVCLAHLATCTLR